MYHDIIKLDPEYVMFREIRRKEKKLTDEECHEILTKAEYGTLATMDADGFPYAVALNYIFHDESIYFHCALVGHKLDNIAKCSKVSFNVVTDVWVVPIFSEDRFSGFDTNFNNVIIFGKAKEVMGAQKREVLKAFVSKFLNVCQCNTYAAEGAGYAEGSMARVKLFQIEIEHMTGKRGIAKNKEIRGNQDCKREKL